MAVQQVTKKNEQKQFKETVQRGSNKHQKHMMSIILFLPHCQQK